MVLTSGGAVTHDGLDAGCAWARPAGGRCNTTPPPTPTLSGVAGGRGDRRSSLTAGATGGAAASAFFSVAPSSPFPLSSAHGSLCPVRSIDGIRVDRMPMVARSRRPVQAVSDGLVADVPGAQPDGLLRHASARKVRFGWASGRDPEGVRHVRPGAGQTADRGCAKTRAPAANKPTVGCNAVSDGSGRHRGQLQRQLIYRQGCPDFRTDQDSERGRQPAVAGTDHRRTHDGAE